MYFGLRECVAFTSPLRVFPPQDSGNTSIHCFAECFFFFCSVTRITFVSGPESLAGSRLPQMAARYTLHAKERSPCTAGRSPHLLPLTRGHACANSWEPETHRRPPPSMSFQSLSLFTIPQPLVAMEATLMSSRCHALEPTREQRWLTTARKSHPPLQARSSYSSRTFTVTTSLPHSALWQTRSRGITVRWNFRERFNKINVFFNRFHGRTGVWQNSSTYRNTQAVLHLIDLWDSRLPSSFWLQTHGLLGWHTLLQITLSSLSGQSVEDETMYSSLIQFLESLWTQSFKVHLSM